MKFSVHFNAAAILHSRAICFDAFSQIALRMTWYTVALTGSVLLLVLVHENITGHHLWFLVDCVFIKAPFVTYWQSLVRAHEYLHFDIKSLLYSTEAKFYRPVKHKTIIFAFSPKLIFWCYHLLVLTGRYAVARKNLY